MISKRGTAEERNAKSVSVVIPVLNESATIASIVRFALEDPVVGEVIVVDDGSIDGTPALAEEAGARVITSTLLGKGASMEDGMRAARHEFVLYLDGDLKGLHRDCIELMTRPLMTGEADFVKAKFTRRAGRVTVLTAKPLLKTYFPELAHLEQPLSGIMAARKTLLEELLFENDYGVDVALLIDATFCGARVVEVDVGHLEHRSQSLEALGEMATQVARAILERAATAGRLRGSFVREVKERERLSRSELPHLLERVPSSDRLALFDMDGVILQGRFVMDLAKATGRETELQPLLDNYGIPPGDRVRQIGALFAGVPRAEFERLAREIPLMPEAVETVIGLRKAGYKVGIVTDSYHVVAEIVRRRVFADFSFAHFMRFKNHKATGRVTLCPAMVHTGGCTLHDYCKLNVLEHLKERFDFTREHFVAIGDGITDICMLQHAGCSIAFKPRTAAVERAAQYITDDLRDVLQITGTENLPMLRMEGRDTEAEAHGFSRLGL